jgi:hypothetical protein
LTGKTDLNGNTHTLLGIVEHGSRANLALSVLKDKTVLTLLEQLIGIRGQWEYVDSHRLVVVVKLLPSDFEWL